MTIYNASTREITIPISINEVINIPPFPGSVEINKNQLESLKKSKTFNALEGRGQIVVGTRPTNGSRPPTEKETPQHLKPIKTGKVKIKTGEIEITSDTRTSAAEMKTGSVKVVKNTSASKLAAKSDGNPPIIEVS